MEFKDFNQHIKNQMDKMCRTGKLFVTDVDREVLWDLYLDSFPAGTNDIYKVRREYDCSCCHNFMRQFGHIVSINEDDSLSTIWDLNINEGPYNIVVKKLAEYVKSGPIKELFIAEFANLGTEVNYQTTETGILEWYHFHYKLDNKFVNRNNRTIIGPYTDVRNSFERSLNEITMDAVDTVLDLIAQGSLYKGEESRNIIYNFKLLKNNYDLTPDDKKANWLWKNLKVDFPEFRLRGISIGTLLMSISEGINLDTAVAKYEAMVAPENYKRPNAIFTTKMIAEAQQKCQELNIDLGRRYASKDDISVNNVIFIDREVTNSMKDDDIFGEMQKNVHVKVSNKIEEVSIEDFINNVVPNVTKIECLVENKHRNNFVTLIAPKKLDSTKMFKWDNNFSWNYKGQVTDSIKEKVKTAGGNVEGYLRISLAWYNTDDLDLAVRVPNQSKKIHYANRRDDRTLGELDIDMNVSNLVENAVENITFPRKDRLIEGIYVVYVNNFKSRNSDKQGFEIEIEVENEIYSIPVASNRSSNQAIAEIEYRNGEITVRPLLDSRKTSKKIDNIDTNVFKTLSMLMFSPNYWDGNSIGHKHYFFMLEDAIAEGSPRGFFNEYLRDDLITHKRMFEALGGKLIVEPLENPLNQLTGLGFSSTSRNELTVRVQGSFTRILKIKF